MPNPRWTYNVPFTDFPGPSSAGIRGGHPTAVGPNDPYVFRRARDGARGIGNGSPGIPRLIPGPTHFDPLPTFLGRPMQPGTNYNQGSDLSGP